MNEVLRDAWHPKIRLEVGQILARALTSNPETAHTIAASLAPEGRGPGTRFSVYENNLDHPAREVAYQTHFTGITDFLAVLEVGDPGAIELALIVASQMAPEAIVPVAKLMLPLTPWKFLGRALGRALGAMNSRESFELLLGCPEIPYLRDGLSTNAYPDGVDKARSAYQDAGDLAGPNLDPRHYSQTLPILSYLLRHDPENVFPELIRLSKAGDYYAVHALSALPKGREFLIEELTAASAGKPLNFSQKMAIKIIIENDPSTAIDTLGGLDFLESMAGRPHLEEVLNCLRDDTWRVKKGWLVADPRFAELCMGLKSDPKKELAALARDLLRTLPASAKPKPAKTTRHKIEKPAEIDPAIITEMENIRKNLEEIIQNLKTEKYRFAEPKHILVPPSKTDLRAISKLEKIVPIPPVLKAFWQIVGSVDLRGHHPKWERAGYLGFPDATEPVILADPLVIGPPSKVIDDALDEHAEAPIQLVLGPDALGKAGYSGGVLSLTLPQENPDPRFDSSEETLQAHLSKALKGHGFLGL